MSDNVKNIVRELNEKVKTSYGSLNTLDYFIKIHKDILRVFSKKNMIYKISCLNCSISYVEQINRKLQTRISEHRNHIEETLPRA